jgi:hypothetical protein
MENPGRYHEGRELGEARGGNVPEEDNSGENFGNNPDGGESGAAGGNDPDEDNSRENPGNNPEGEELSADIALMA